MGQRSVSSAPGDVAAAQAPSGATGRIGPDAGPTSGWLSRGLRGLGPPEVVVDATAAAGRVPQRGRQERHVASLR